MITDIPFVIYIEATPNPSSLKFVANKLLIAAGASAEYTHTSDLKQAPLPKALLAFPFVKSIYVSANYISVQINEIAQWEDVQHELRIFISDYLNKGGVIIEKVPEKLVPKDSSFKENILANTHHEAPKNDIETKIIEILDQYIKPAVERDGGLITFKQLQNKIVTVQMRGSCSGCPSSSMTLKAGIEALLKRLLPNDVTEVISEAV
ncbi:MAG: NifU family protein [Bacteroidetes bacterium]|nr:NifU family protein [Bacteroidota bacterium]